MKRIILLLDGTWNDAEFGATDTNIVRLRDIIDRSLDKSSPPVSSDNKSLASSPEEKIVKGRTFGGRLEHIVFYERGVGTGPFLDRFRGGVFGAGLANNIRGAYKFLSFHYQPGDQIFVFGFSRGSYTARSLVGYIAAAGLLRRDCCTTELESKSWYFYRTPPQDRMPATWTELQKSVYDPEKFQIECVAVFDTVGALGIPLSALSRANRQHYEFHDVELSPIVKVSLHALAIDEHRQPFQATVWRKPKFKRSSTVTEQVWFAGAHADIGGGYLDQEARVRNGIKALDDISLDWMIKRVCAHFPDFPATSSSWSAPGSDWATAAQHESRRRIYRLLPFAFRSIANYRVRCRRWPWLPLHLVFHRRFRLHRSLPRGLFEVNVSYDRHASTVNESVHISTIERLGRQVSIDNRLGIYVPRNLLAVLSRIEQTYGGDAKPTTEVHVIKWSGNVFDPNDASDRTEVLTALSAARKRIDAMAQ